MGFTVAGGDHFYASDHAGPGGDLPNPVGLIESTDGGQIWTVVSSEGVTDIHALSASKQEVVGFDGSDVLLSLTGVLGPPERRPPHPCTRWRRHQRAMCCSRRAPRGRFGHLTGERPGRP